MLCELISQFGACFAADSAELDSFKTELFAINLSSTPESQFQPIKLLTRRKPLMQNKAQTVTSERSSRNILSSAENTKRSSLFQQKNDLSHHINRDFFPAAPSAILDIKHCACSSIILRKIAPRTHREHTLFIILHHTIHVSISVAFRTVP